MTATSFTTLTKPDSDDAIRAGFVYHLPRILKHAKYALRHVGSADTRAELTAETVALAWKHFAVLSRRGKRPETFITTLALRCSQAVRHGRRVAGADAARDVLSPVAKARHGFDVVRMGDRVPAPGARPAGPGGADVVAEALAVDPRARVPEQAALRVDFPAWRSRFGARDRAVLDALAGGDRTGEVAERFGLTRGRVSQLRGAFAADWAAFHRGER